MRLEKKKKLRNILNLKFSKLIYPFELTISKTSLIGLFLFLLFPFYGLSQISGTVTDTLSQPIPFATVLLKKSLDSSLVAYTQTAKDGFYKIDAKATGKHFLTFNSLSHAKKNVEIDVVNLNKEVKIDVTLKEQQLELKEIVINADLPIRVKKDTIIIDAKAFMTGNEDVVEDLLKKIPGLTVDSEGTIKINNQEVEKVMVEGDDFFEKGYKILTKNMPAQPLNKIEILKRYSNNKLLKGVEESDKVALNLTLDEDAKQQWFGNVELGHDVQGESIYEGRFNLMSFGKRNKYYFLGAANSTGYDATGDISSLISPYRYGEPGRVGDGVQTDRLFSLQGTVGNFDRRRSNFNNAELLSLNAIFNPTDSLKIKTLGFFNWDEKDFFRDRTNTFFANDTDFTNTEDLDLRNIYETVYGKIQLNYDIEKGMSLESVTSYSDRGNDAVSDLQFNGASTLEQLNSTQQRLDHMTALTYRMKNDRVLLLSARYINEQLPQNYSVNQYFFDNLFDISPSPESVVQNLEQRLQYGGFNAHYLDRRENGHLLELQLGNEFTGNELDNVLRFRESENSNNFINAPDDYQNDLIYNVNDLYAKTKYLYKIDKKLKATGQLDAHQVTNRIDQIAADDNQAVFFINPSLDLKYQIDSKNKLGLGINHNTTNAGVLDVFENYALLGFNSLIRGTGDFNQLERGSVQFNYTLGNWSDKFFANVMARYGKDHDFFSTDALIRQQFTQTDKILIEDRENVLLNATVDYYISPLSSNLKSKFSYTETEFKNRINGSELREIQSFNTSAGFELRSAFSGAFNYHLGSTWNINRTDASGISNRFTDNKSFIDLSYIINERIDFFLKSERYEFGNISDGDNVYYFLDFDARYNVKDSPWSFKIQARNLTNTEQFRTSFINDVSSSTVSYRLLPRYVLLSAKYRF